MPSPFPGMDPYLEASGYWEDFHDSFLTSLRNALRGALPSAYSVYIQERVTSITLPGHDRTHFVPDVGVTTSDSYRPAGGVATISATDRQPVVLEHDLEESAMETYLEITRRSDRKPATLGHPSDLRVRGGGRTLVVSAIVRDGRSRPGG